MPLSAETFQYPSVMELAMRSARSGSVAARASATLLSADAFQELLVMELTMGAGAAAQTQDAKRLAAARLVQREARTLNQADSPFGGRATAALPWLFRGPAP